MDVFRFPVATFNEAQALSGDCFGFEDHTPCKSVTLQAFRRFNGRFSFNYDPHFAPGLLVAHLIPDSLSVSSEKADIYSSVKSMTVTVFLGCCFLPSLFLSYCFLWVFLCHLMLPQFHY